MNFKAPLTFPMLNGRRSLGPENGLATGGILASGSLRKRAKPGMALSACLTNLRPKAVNEERSGPTLAPGR